jgi:uncharacterized delta-60 repeat protein
MYPRPFTLIALLLPMTLTAPSVHAAPGDLDLTFAGFGNGGTVITTGVPMPVTHYDEDAIRGLALQPDGKIVVVGYTGVYLLVMRYLPNGALDTTFGVGGIAKLLNPQFAVRGTSVAIQADGKIIAAGWADTSPFEDFMLARLTASGALDPTFGGDGFVTTDFQGGPDKFFTVLIQPDGKIVAAGRAWIPNDFDFATARYNPDGSPDATFGGDGKVFNHFGGDEACFDIALQADGKLLIAGGDIGSPFIDSDFEMARLNTNGTLDGSFSGDGELTIGFGQSYETVAAVAIQPDGKIVVAGDDSPIVGYQASAVHALVARCNANGTLDGSFSGDGKLKIDGLSGGIRDLAVQPDGRIMVLGWHESPDGDYKVTLYRLDPDGSMDLTFDGDGNLLVDLGGYAFGHALALQTDGRIIAYGANNTTHVLVRLWPDGSFDTGGQQTLGFPDTWTEPGLPKDVVDEVAYGMAVQSDGKIVLVGDMSNAAHTETDFALSRFLPDGLLDTSFGVQGRAQLGFFQYDLARAVAIQPDGKIVVAGTMENGSVRNFMVARFNADGSEDGTFGFGGLNVIDFLGGDDFGTALALAPDGKIVVAGTVFNGARYVFGVARFNSDGTPDNSFDLDAKQLLEFVPGPTHAVTAVIVQPDRKIVVGGHVNANFALARFNENGSLDFTFGLSGMIQTDMGGSDFLNALAVAPNGWLYAAGVRDIAGDEDFALAQYKPNGTLASCPPFPCSNWPTGKAFVDWGGPGVAYAVNVRGDGQVVAAGCANGQFAWAQLRPNTLVGGPIKGSTDFVGTIECGNAVKFVGQNQIVAAGFQNFNGDLNFALARFETTLDPTAVDVPTAVTPAANLFETLGPNPTSGSTELAFALARDAQVRVHVHDIAGRLVRLLDIGRLPAGRHQETWDARGNDGQRVLAGVYFVGLEIDGRRLGAKRLAIVR